MKRLRKMTKTTWEAQAIGASYANTGKTLSKSHRAAISKSTRAAWKRHKGKVLEAIKVGPYNEVVYFKTCADAARALGCSKQLVCQAVKCKTAFSARGYVFKWVLPKDIIKFDK